MTTRTIAAVAERLDRLADQMRETAIVIGGNRSVTPARPHIIGAARTVMAWPRSKRQEYYGRVTKSRGDAACRRLTADVSAEYRKSTEVVR